MSYNNKNKQTKKSSTSVSSNAKAAKLAYAKKKDVMVKPVVVEDVSEESYTGTESSMGDEYTQEDMNADYNDGGDNANNANEDEMTEAEKAMEADMTWDTVKYHFDHEFDLNELVTDSNKGLKLEKGCALVLSVENGLLKMGHRSHSPDFIEGESLSHQNSDIVKSVDIYGLEITGWKEDFLVNLSTVPKFQEEGHFGESKTVNRLISPYELKDPAQPINICDRTISKAMMHFQKRFPGVSPENLTKDIKKNNEDTFLVNLSSPLIATINSNNAADTETGKYEKPDLIKTNQVLVPKQTVKKYRPQTLEMMRKGVSYANITDNQFQISLEVPLPSTFKQKHDDYVKTKGVSGRQFLAFADTPYKTCATLGSAINTNIKSRDELFKDPANRFIRVKGMALVRYKKMNRSVMQDL